MKSFASQGDSVNTGPKFSKEFSFEWLLDNHLGCSFGEELFLELVASKLSKKKETKLELKEHVSWTFDFLFKLELRHVEHTFNWYQTVELNSEL